MNARLPTADGRRIACIDVPALPLQIVLRAHPDWHDDPVVVVEDDRPQARILWANHHARREQIIPGLRFQQAKALVPRVHAAAVPPADIDQTTTELLRLLLAFSPEIEPARDQPGQFFADAHGLHALYTGLDHWAHTVHQTLTARRFVAAIVVGFTRFAVAALARQLASKNSGWLVLRDLADEQTRAAAVPLTALDIPFALRDQLHTLGLQTLGEFLALPPADLRRRFGEPAAALHTRAHTTWAPLTGTRPAEPVTFAFDFELPDTDLQRLLAAFADRLHGALQQLADRRHLLTGLQLTLFLEHHPPHRERLTTAAPTRDTDQVLELVRLRLEQTRLPSPIERFETTLASVEATRQQLELLATARRRDLAAADRALARVRAAFGDAAITRARLLPHHLPEQTFRYEPLTNLTLPRERTAAPSAPRPLVRTLLRAPQLLGSLPVHEPESWLPEFGAVQRAHGPFRVRSGWWQQLVERDYFFLETDRGAILWVFHDRRQRRWYLHGRVD
ncbi:MAG: DNA polymerase Y family protein [Planctomycetes bacterium]|nr:DNA polymerase Y family protein [Planctomycetota bacterium]